MVYRPRTTFSLEIDRTLSFNASFYVIMLSGKADSVRACVCARTCVRAHLCVCMPVCVCVCFACAPVCVQVEVEEFTCVLDLSNICVMHARTHAHPHT